MRKIIKKYGGSYVMILSPEDLQVHDLELGDVVDIGDLVKVKDNKFKGDFRK